MIRIRVIFIGHNHKEFIKEQREYRQSIASNDTQIETTSIKDGPETVEQDLDEIFAGPAIFKEAKQAEAEGVQAVVIDCALDPVLSGLREGVRIPIVGAGQAAFSIAITLGERFSILAPLKSLVPAYRRRIREYGLGQHCASIRSINFPILDLLSVEAKKAFIDTGVAAIEEDGANVIVMGCTGMSPAIPNIQEKLQVPVVDPAGAAIFLAETLIKMKLSHSNRSFFYRKM